MACRENPRAAPKGCKILPDGRAAAQMRQIKRGVFVKKRQKSPLVQGGGVVRGRRAVPAVARVFAAARGAPSSVGADSISARGVCAAAGCGGMRASRPTVVRVGGGRSFGPDIFGRFVGEGHAPPAGPCATVNIHGRAMALPYEPAQMPPPSGWPETQNLSVGAGFIPPGAFAVPRGARDDASIVPYRGLL